MKRITKIIFLSFAIFISIFCHNIFATTEITKIQAINDIENNQTKIIFYFSDKVNYEAFSLGNPLRFVIDLPDTDNLAYLNRAFLSESNINNIRFGKHENNSLRIVFDIKKPAHFKHYFSDKKLIVELISIEKKPKVIKNNLISRKHIVIEKPPVLNKPAVLSNNIPIKNIEQKSPKIDLSPTLAFAGNKNVVQPKLQQTIIVIDPGHGGKDSGAKGLGGTLEKDVVLNVAKYLQDDLNKIPGFKAILTRNADYFLPLSERLRIAHSNKPDLFISIHADVYKHSYHVNGTSIFALSEKGATTEAARWLAEEENVSELGKDNDAKSNVLKSVLIDIAQNSTINKSLQIGDVLLKQLNTTVHIHSKAVEQAAFVVLKSPEIPSLLVEVGFLSDPHEELDLRDLNYEQKFSAALAEGIKNYFSNSFSSGV